MTQSEPTETLAKAYVPADFEHAIYERWLAADVFAPDGAGSTADWALEPFVIIQPPPNVTGSLHVGHAQRTTVEDLMTRHARMQGRPTLFLPGLDHASIAAQYVLDGILAREGESRATLGRERYLARMRRVHRGDQVGHPDPAATRRGQLRLGPPAVHDGRHVGARGSRGVPAPAPQGPGVPRRGARQLVSRLPHERQRPRDHPHARGRHAVAGPLPPDRRVDRSARSRGDADRSDHSAGDDPGRHRGRRPSRRQALRGAGGSPRPDPVR